MALSMSVIVCAHNEAQYLAAWLHSLLAQSRVTDEILVINKASTDASRGRPGGEWRPGRARLGGRRLPGPADVAGAR